MPEFAARFTREVQSLVALWLFHKFGLSLAAAGLFFFWAGALSALSYPVAAWLSQRIGLVNTMVYTHMPSSLCLILAAVVPNLELALPGGWHILPEVIFKTASKYYTLPANTYD